MTAIASKRKAESPSLGGDSLLSTGLKYLALFIIDAFALIIVYTLLADANWGLGIIVAIATIGANIITFVPALYPLRWMNPGLVLVTLLVIYPIFYTVTTSFTNYGDGHLLTKQQSIALISQRKFVPEDARIYDWALFQSETTGEYALWLTRALEDDGVDEIIFARAKQPLETVDTDNPLLENYEGYTRVPRIKLAQALGTVQNMVFGTGDDTAAIRNRNEAARPLVQRFVWDAEANAFTDLQTGQVYRANDETGTFEPVGDGELLAPGYRVNIGFDNFRRLVNDPALSGPLVIVFIWTVMFAFFSVFTTFALGLFMAIILNDAAIPGKKIIRSLLIIPYAVPGVIGIVVWKGLLNQQLGIVTNVVADITGYTIPWFSDPGWAKVAVILVNLWLGYPYMMLVASGALQAIPSDVYEAAAVDGANARQKFWRITLPLLLVTMGPLLIASFVYNFNNFLIIEALTEGKPPIPGTPTPAGFTDILISYTFRLAFGSSRGADYGYASAITIIIFLLIAVITLMQYRFTKAWEEVGENV